MRTPSLSFRLVTGAVAGIGLLALTPAPAVASTSPSATAASGSFTAVTYNVSGLPAAVNSAPTPRQSATEEIGRRISPFELVNVQEDFN